MNIYNFNSFLGILEINFCDMPNPGFFRYFKTSLKTLTPIY